MVEFIFNNIALYSLNADRLIKQQPPAAEFTGPHAYFAAYAGKSVTLAQQLCSLLELALFDQLNIRRYIKMYRAGISAGSREV